MGMLGRRVKCEFYGAGTMLGTITGFEYSDIVIDDGTSHEMKWPTSIILDGETDNPYDIRWVTKISLANDD